MNILINSGRTVPFFTTRRKLITSIINNGHKVIVTGYQEGYEQEVKEMGAEFIKVPLQRAGFNPFYDLKLLINYYKIIKRNNVEIVHSYTIKPNIYGSIAARIAGLNRIFPTLNGLGYAFSGKGLKARLTRIIASILYWIAFKCSRNIFFHNNDDINLIVNSKLTKRKKCVLTLGSGIDMDYYKKEDIPEEISFLLISRLLKAKGIHEYILAAKEVKLKYPNVVFNLVGPEDPNPTGIKIEEIKEFIENDIIKYHGSQKDVRPFLKNSSVYVLPSYREGLPHSVLEAMSTGRAIITTDVPGCRETVVNNRNGLLVELQNVNDLKEKLIYLIENPMKVKEMGKESLLLARELFEVRKVNDIIINTMKLN